MFVSLIITTYNWKEALELSLLSIFRQIDLPGEIIVADDGSASDTTELVHTMQQRSPVPLIHSWQEDKGFRLARSRNKAIAKSCGEYIILIDGDIILERHFIQDHSKFARQGYFIQGSRVLLGPDASAKALKEKKLVHCLTDRDLQNRKNCFRCSLLARLLSWRNMRISGVKTCNFAFWRQDAIKVNGFNEEFIGWGREDSEFTARLFNSGLQRRNVRFNAIGYHLDHPMNDRERLPVNDCILEQTVQEKCAWCGQGLNQHFS